MKEAGRKEEEIEEVILAGAFGSFINPESAKTIGLIPQGAKTTSVGNASLYGAKKLFSLGIFAERLKCYSRKPVMLNFQQEMIFLIIFINL